MDKKNISIAAVLLIVLGGYFLFQRAQPAAEKIASGTNVGSDGVQVVTTFYPLQQLAAGIVGDMGEVTAIVPAGMEPHDYEPSMADIRSIYDADLFVLNGAGMDAWAEKLMPELEAKGIRSIRLADKVELLSAKEGSEHEHGDGHEEEKVEPVGMGTVVEDEHEHGEWDPHFWLDPMSAKMLVVAMTEALSEKFPDRRAVFVANSEGVIARLNDLDVAYRMGLASCSKDEVVTSHDAFRYLAHRYGFETHALAGISPEEEPSPKRLTEIATEVKEEGIKYIFLETLVSPKLAETLARETGASTLVFNPIEGVSDADQAAGNDYFSLMRDNLAALQKALECN
ncbi:MAG: zinc ABC transporter substrate-binding protein [Candidatus Moraniibacteriota bacterium]